MRSKNLHSYITQLKDDRLIGVISYYKREPAGFVESFPLDIATKLGYPVSEVTGNKLLITCLSVRTEVWGNGIGSKLIKKLEKEAEKNNYKALEVISFPNERNWRPKSLYKKLGFKEIKKIGELSILQKPL